MMRDLLACAQAAGFQKLLVTADVPAASRREDMRVAGAPLGSFRSQVTPRIFLPASSGIPAGRWPPCARDPCAFAIWKNMPRPLVWPI